MDKYARGMKYVDINAWRDIYGVGLGFGVGVRFRCVVGARLPRPYYKCLKNWINFTQHWGK